MYNSTFFTDAEIINILGVKTPTTPEIDQAISDAVVASEAALRDYLQTEVEVALREEFLPASEFPGDPGSVGYPTIYPNVTRLASPHASYDTLALRYIPVILDSDLRVWHDPDAKGGQRPGSFTQELEIGVHFFLDVESGGISKTGLIYIERTILSYPRSVKVQYRSGTTDPKRLAAILTAMRIILIHWFRIIVSSRVGADVSCKKNRGPLTSESFGGYSYSVNTQLEIGIGSLGGGQIPLTAMHMLQPYRNYQYML